MRGPRTQAGSKLSAKAASPRNGSSTVSFRLSGALLQQLAESAKASGASLGEQARELVLGALSDVTHRATLAELALVREEVQRLRADVATTLELLLLNVANLSEEEVKRFVRTNLHKEETPP